MKEFKKKMGEVVGGGGEGKKALMEIMDATIMHGLYSLFEQQQQKSILV